jgi:hypothetical protein
VRRWWETLTNDRLLKLTALGLAFLLWTLVETDNRVGIDAIPVVVANADAGWVLAAEPEPSSVEVVFSGPVRELIRVAAERPEILVPIDSVRDTTDVVVLRPTWVALGNGMDNTRVEEITPRAVRLRFDRVTTRMIPVTVSVVGEPEAGYEFVGQIALEPTAIRASGASRVLDTLDTVRLPAIDLGRRMATDTIVIPVDSLGPGIIAVPRQVRAIVEIRPIKADSVPGVLREADQPR